MKSSVAVVRQDRQLLVLPVVSMVATISMASLFVAAVWHLHPIVSTSNDGFGRTRTGLSFTPTSLLLTFAGLFVVTFIGMFFQAALISAAHERLSGGEPSLKAAMVVAVERVGSIALWALFSVTVSTAIRQASQRLGFVGRIVVSLVGAVWSVATIFVLPVLVIEGGSVKEAFDGSKSLVRRTWGEQIVGQGLISMIVMPVILVWSILCVVAFIAVGLAAIAIFIIGLFAMIAFSMMISVVYSTSLYQFATTGVVPSGFQSDDLLASFGPKKSKR